MWNGGNSSVENSPHVKFLKLYRKIGKKIFKQLDYTDYCKMFLYWDEVKYGLGGRNKKYREKKAKRLASVFDSIRKNGYDKKNYIHILKTPLWVTRGFFGGDNLLSPEIFHGHHRVACCYVLGIKKIRAYICKDINPNSLMWPQNLPSTYHGQNR